MKHSENSAEVMACSSTITVQQNIPSSGGSVNRYWTQLRRQTAEYSLSPDCRYTCHLAQKELSNYHFSSLLNVLFRVQLEVAVRLRETPDSSEGQSERNFLAHVAFSKVRIKSVNIFIISTNCAEQLLGYENKSLRATNYWNALVKHCVSFLRFTNWK